MILTTTFEKWIFMPAFDLGVGLCLDCDKRCSKGF